MSLEEMFSDDTAPFRTVYETAQAVVNDYMTLHNCKIEKVAEQLGTTRGYLYGTLDPNQTHRPLSVDRIIEITNLTGDHRIIDSIKEALKCVDKHVQCTITDVMMVGLKIQSHTGSLSETLFEAVKDGEIDEKEGERIRRMAMDEITALYSIIGMTK
ncbi:phage regulatory CII family protein [Sulfuricurvum sp.]|uniref:phage regulatory CII family protein n=1 Tax=Sulfuricurvum sp. TaxID=2025608 RepID=UPI002E2FBF68|nr:phage regulatory CII family protein [Sulfuricurvum sp.]HEX5330809.1 phage regulatory CII family protein [Sulfuricurvum sp.]